MPATVRAFEDRTPVNTTTERVVPASFQIPRYPPIIGTTPFSGQALCRMLRRDANQLRPSWTGVLRLNKTSTYWPTAIVGAVCRKLSPWLLAGVYLLRSYRAIHRWGFAQEPEPRIALADIRSKHSITP
jgi:hypothetical protein